ncbi:MAG: hypothetical protein JO169_01395 [Solirubrobacterales bacterium]|nr:hypothetical protein [Solirubrobacterales bacterium]
MLSEAGGCCWEESEPEPVSEGAARAGEAEAGEYALAWPAPDAPAADGGAAAWLVTVPALAADAGAALGLGLAAGDAARGPE